MNCCGDLVPAICHACMWEGDHASRSQRFREVPLPSSVEQPIRACGTESLMLFAVELMNIVLQLVAIQFHRDPFSLNDYGLQSPALQFLDRRDF